MPRVISPIQTIVKVVPRDGALEVTLNINVTVDGKVNISEAEEKEQDVEKLIPQFSSGKKILNFNKEQK